MLALIPLVSWLLLVFVWSFVFGRYRHGSANRSFLVLAGCSALWVSLELLFYIPAFDGYEDLILHGVIFCWIPIGFLFLVFTYCLTGRRLDWIWVLSAVVTTAGVILDLSTDLFLDGHTRYGWGVSDGRNVFNHTILCLVPVCSSLWGLWLVFNARRRTVDAEQRKPLTLLLVGGFLTLSATMAVSIIIPNILQLDDFPRFGSSSLAVFVFVVFLAVVKHDFLNVTVEKVAEELFDDAKSGIALVGPDGKITRMNRAALKMTGWSGRSAVGQAIDCVLPGPSPVLRTGKHEVDLITGGGRRTLEVSTTTRTSRDVIIGSILLLRDISGQRMAKEVLERSRDDLEEEVRRRTMELRLAQKVEAMGALAGGIAHDFNNLLAAIMGFANAACDDLPPQHPARNDFLEVLKATRQARDIVRRMLEFSRYEVPARELVDAGAVMVEAEELLADSLPATIKLHLERDEGPHGVLGDRTEIRQVLINLGTNAFQAIGSRFGEIWMRCFFVDLDADFVRARNLPWTGKYVRLQVEDTGHGMSKEVLRDIFEPFFTTREEGKGTGLGLATVKRITEDHGGTIIASSEPGCGAIFDVYLPYIASTARGNDLMGIGAPSIGPLPPREVER